MLPESFFARSVSPPWSPWQKYQTRLHPYLYSARFVGQGSERLCNTQRALRGHWLAEQHNSRETTEFEDSPLDCAPIDSP